MALEGRRWFLIAPPIRTRQADRAVLDELTRLGVDSVIRLNGQPVRRGRVPVTMRTRVIQTPRPSPSAGA